MNESNLEKMPVVFVIASYGDYKLSDYLQKLDDQGYQRRSAIIDCWAADEEVQEQLMANLEESLDDIDEVHITPPVAELDIAERLASICVPPAVRLFKIINFKQEYPKRIIEDAGVTVNGEAVL